VQITKNFGIKKKNSEEEYALLFRKAYYEVSEIKMV